MRIFSLCSVFLLLVNECIDVRIFSAYGALHRNINTVNQDEMSTALDAIRKMVTINSNEAQSREQATTVITSSGVVPSTRYSSLLNSF